MPRLGFEMGPLADGDRLPAISPDSEGNPGQPMGLQNGPFWLSNHGAGSPKLWEFKGRCRAGGNDARSGATFSATRVSNAASSGHDISSAISPEFGGGWGDKIRRNHVHPIAVLRGAPILNHNRAGVGPILGIESAPPPEALNSALKLSNP